MKAVIEGKKLTRHYPMGDTVVKALRGVDMAVEEGELLAIMGPSGSGKSTMMHLVGCLDTPTDGKLFIGGEDVSEMDEVELAYVRNERIGFIFQQFHLLSKLNILENVGTPLLYAGVGIKERNERSALALERVGLADRINHRPNELSGGQRQRVAIARALVNEPDIILADEPTGNLDTATGNSILDIFSQLHEEGNTVVIVTHDPEVTEFCERAIRLRDGRIESDGT